jgi:hypothetical protein
MFVILAIFLLLLSPLVMAILRLVLRLRARDEQALPEQSVDRQDQSSPVRRMVVARSSPAAYYWLLALAGTLAAWILVLLSRPRQSYALLLVHWSPVTYFPDSPKILVDPISWSFALALATLVLVVILTVPVRLQGNNWHAWASSLAMTGFGLIAVLAGNPLTLMLAWAAIDILEIFILLVQVRESKVHLQALVVFAARVGGLGLLLWADITSRTAGNLWIPLDGRAAALDGAAGAVPLSVSLILLIAAGLRLGVLPLRLPYLQEPPIRRGLGTSLRLIPAAASLILLARTAYAGVPASWAPFLLVLVGLSAIYGAFLWASAPDELSGRPYWILGMTAFAVASAVCGMPQASLSWGLACILSGGLLFLYSARHSMARHRYLLLLPMLGLLGFIGLPFTPNWDGMQLYTSRTIFYILPLFLFAHAFLISGYILHAVRSGPNPEQPQRWVWLLYPLGLALFPAIQYVGWWQSTHWPSEFRSALVSTGATHFPFLTWIAGVIAFGLSGLIFWITYQRYPSDNLPDRPRHLLVTLGQRIFSMQWVYNILGIAFRFSIRLVGFLTGLLEGDGGILWVLVLLALLVVVLLSGGRL